MGMRGRLVAVLAGLAAVVMVCAAGAWGAPRVTLRVRPVPIAGFAHTGNIAGAGTAIEMEYGIAGTESNGFPPPLVGLNLSMPAGMTVDPATFPTCRRGGWEAPPEVEPGGQSGCPRGSAAGPAGAAEGFVAFGKGIVPEAGTIESFYAPGGGLAFEILGHDPVLLEIFARAHYATAHGLFSKSLEADLPLVETIPGGADASISSLAVKFGTATRVGRKTVYYLRLPGACPRGYLPWKAELTFAAPHPVARTRVTARYDAPCPRRR